MVLAYSGKRTSREEGTRYLKIVLIRSRQKSRQGMKIDRYGLGFTISEIACIEQLALRNRGNRSLSGQLSQLLA